MIAYASRMLTKSERKYCVTRKEMLGLVWGAQQFRPYLYGQRFIAQTDHNALKWLQSFHEPEGQVARWLELLSEFEFQVQHRSGQKHTNADALSRSPCHQCGLLVARFLASSSSTVACILNHPSLAPVKMHANERIGQFQPLGSQVPLPATAQVSAVVPTHQI